MINDEAIAGKINHAIVGDSMPPNAKLTIHVNVIAATQQPRVTTTGSGL